MRNPNIKTALSAPQPTMPSVTGVFSASGKPAYQHDRHLIHTHDPTTTIYAIADGHGPAATGHIVSDHCVLRLPSLLRKHNALSPPAPDTPTRLVEAIRALDKSSIRATAAQRLYAGSTLCTVIRHTNTLLCANVGDSRAILVSVGVSRPHITQLSRDHVCTDIVERARIEEAGGVVVGKLLNGYISMSRAIGDDDLKAHRNLTNFPVPGLTATYADTMFSGEAEITQTPLDRHAVFLVVASDGVWSHLRNDDVSAIVCKALSAGGCADTAAKAVVKRALSKGSRDNATAIVALLSDVDSVKRALSAIKREKTGSPAEYYSTTTCTGTRKVRRRNGEKSSAPSSPSAVSDVEHSGDGHSVHNGSHGTVGDGSVPTDSNESLAPIPHSRTAPLSTSKQRGMDDRDEGMQRHGSSPFHGNTMFGKGGGKLLSHGWASRVRSNLSSFSGMSGK